MSSVICLSVTFCIVAGMTDRPQMFAPAGGFWRWPIQWTHAKCCGADPCCHGNEIWAKIAYKSACMADRPQMFAPTRGFSGMADSMELCKMLRGRPLLPWQRHLALARRSSRLLDCLSVCLSVTFCIVAKQHILAKNCLKEQIGLPPETTLRYQFGPLFLP